MNRLFERLSLQGHLKRIIDEYGEEQGWQIIHAALERQLAWLESQRLRKYRQNEKEHS